MHILQVVPTYLPATRYGGPIFSVHSLSRALVARGHKVDVFTTNIDGPVCGRVPVGVPTDLDGVRGTYATSMWSISIPSFFGPHGSLPEKRAPPGFPMSFLRGECWSKN